MEDTRGIIGEGREEGRKRGLAWNKPVASLCLREREREREKKKKRDKFFTLIKDI